MDAKARDRANSKSSSARLKQLDADFLYHVRRLR